MNVTEVKLKIATDALLDIVTSKYASIWAKERAKQTLERIAEPPQEGVKIAEKVKDEYTNQHEDKPDVDWEALEIVAESDQSGYWDSNVSKALLALKQEIAGVSAWATARHQGYDKEIADLRKAHEKLRNTVGHHADEMCDNELEIADLKRSLRNHTTPSHANADDIADIKDGLNKHANYCHGEWNAARLDHLARKIGIDYSAMAERQAEKEGYEVGEKADNLINQIADLRKKLEALEKWAWEWDTDWPNQLRNKPPEDEKCTCNPVDWDRVAKTGNLAELTTDPNCPIHGKESKPAEPQELNPTKEQVKELCDGGPWGKESKGYCPITGPPAELCGKKEKPDSPNYCSHTECTEYTDGTCIHAAGACPVLESKPDEPREGDLVWREYVVGAIGQQHPVDLYVAEYRHRFKVATRRLVKPTEIDVVKRLMDALKRMAGFSGIWSGVAQEALDNLPDRVRIVREDK